MSNERVPIVAIRANDICFLGLLRSINSVAHVDLHALTFSWVGAPDWLSDKSIYANKVYSISNPADSEEASLDDLISYGKFLKKTYAKKPLVFCSSDVNLIFFHKYEKILSEYYCLPGDRTYKDFRSDIANKGLFYEKIRAHLPDLVLDNIYLFSSQCIEKLNNWNSFPCVIKPAEKDLSQSFYRSNNGLKAIKCEDRISLKKNVEKFLSLKHKLIIQEFIEFNNDTDEIPTYTYFDKNHSLRIYANGIKRIISPPKFGTAIALELSYNKELILISKKVGQAISWHGPLMIEFVIDQKKNRLKILEVNTRPWLFHDFYRQRGLPFIPMMIEEYKENLDYSKNLIVPNSEAIGSFNYDIIKMAELFLKNNKNLSKSNYTSNKLTDDFISFCSYACRSKSFFAQISDDDPNLTNSIVEYMEKTFGFNKDLIFNWILQD